MIFRVTEHATGQPLGDAEVRLPYLDPPQEHRTGQDGVCQFVLPDPLPEALGVRVRKNGFVPMRVLWDLSAPCTSLPADYTLPLARAARIGGRVHDEDGRPIEGVTVFLNIFGEAVSGGSEKVNTDIWEATSVTDAEGRWQFDEAPSDLSRLMFRLRHPDFVEELHFKKADDPAAQFLHGAVVWTLARGVRVEGLVLDHQGRPLGDAELLPGRDRVCSGSKPAFRTDAAGRFSIAHAPQRSASLTVKAGGHAPALLQFPVPTASDPLRISLEPGRKLRARVVNSAGAPLAGAFVFADTWRRHRTLEWRTQTDDDGRFQWADAPSDEVLFDVLLKGYRPTRQIPLTASAEEQTVVLRHSLVIHGTVTDSQTGQPIKEFRIIPGWIHAHRRTYWTRERGESFAGGTYQWSLHDAPGRDSVFLLRVEAEGYRSSVSPIHDSGEEATLDFQLQPGPATIGRVLQPDGTPAGHATLAVVFGNPAQLVGDHLQVGHGNMALTTSADGAFSFPSQEPPYALVAAHALGFALAMADEFDRSPTLHLQPWGRVEITADATAAGASIPFYLHYPDLPKDAQNVPWVAVCPEAKRTSDRRIVFEKLPAGKAFLGRSGQANHQSLNISIESSKTITLDFDRGLPASGERTPGAVVVKVIDESGQPVPGAVVEPSGFSLKGQPGSYSRSMLSLAGSAELVTNSHGVVMVPSPGQFMKGQEVESVSLSVRHPDFCPGRARIPVTGEALPVVLRHGAIVRASGFFEGGGSAGRVYAQIVSPERGGEVDQDTWTSDPNGTLLNRQIPPGEKFLRLVCFPEENRAHFSEVVPVIAQRGEALEFHLLLRPGTRFLGELDATVPRPVLDGHVEVNVLTGSEPAAEPVPWHTWTQVEPDGSFVFASLPPGRVELTALCAGFASKNGPVSQSRSTRTPQTFSVDSHRPPVVVAMEPAAAVRLRITDEKGRPLAGAHAQFSPNVLWAGRSSGLFAGAGWRTDETLRLNREKLQQRHEATRQPARFHGVTGENGSAMILNIPSGKHRYYVTCQGYEMESPGTDRIMPGLREIDLAPGEVRDVSLVMHQTTRGTH